MCEFLSQCSQPTQSSPRAACSSLQSWGKINHTAVLAYTQLPSHTNTHGCTHTITNTQTVRCEQKQLPPHWVSETKFWLLFVLSSGSSDSWLGAWGNKSTCMCVCAGRQNWLFASVHRRPQPNKMSVYFTDISVSPQRLLMNSSLCETCLDRLTNAAAFTVCEICFFCSLMC